MLVTNLQVATRKEVIWKPWQAGLRIDMFRRFIEGFHSGTRCRIVLVVTLHVRGDALGYERTIDTFSMIRNDKKC